MQTAHDQCQIINLIPSGLDDLMAQIPGSACLPRTIENRSIRMVFYRTFKSNYALLDNNMLGMLLYIQETPRA